MKIENLMDYISEQEDIIFVDYRNHRWKAAMGRKYIISHPELDVRVSTINNQIYLYLGNDFTINQLIETELRSEGKN